MTFEERLEALTQTLELTVREQETHRRWIENLREQSEAHERRQADTGTVVTGQLTDLVSPGRGFKGQM